MPEQKNYYYYYFFFLNSLVRLFTVRNNARHEYFPEWIKLFFDFISPAKNYNESKKEKVLYKNEYFLTHSELLGPSVCVHGFASIIWFLFDIKKNFFFICRSPHRLWHTIGHHFFVCRLCECGLLRCVSFDWGECHCVVASVSVCVPTSHVQLVFNDWMAHLIVCVCSVHLLRAHTQLRRFSMCQRGDFECET